MVAIKQVSGSLDKVTIHSCLLIQQPNAISIGSRNVWPRLAHGRDLNDTTNLYSTKTAGLIANDFDLVFQAHYPLNGAYHLFYA